LGSRAIRTRYSGPRPDRDHQGRGHRSGRHPVRQGRVHRSCRHRVRDHRGRGHRSGPRRDRGPHPYRNRARLPGWPRR